MDGVTRIGDAERERAVAAIGEHFAAGRIDREELDERIEAAWRARTEADLAVLFTDLPSAPPVSRPQRLGSQPENGDQWRGGYRHHRPRGGPPPVRMLLLVAIVLAIVLPGPAFLLIPIFWFVILRFAFMRMVSGRRWARRNYGA